MGALRIVLRAAVGTNRGAPAPGIVRVLGVVASLAATSLARDWFVDGAAPQCAQGSGGMQDPFCTVGAALAAAGDGDRILVAPGTYRETLVLDRDVVVLGTAGAAVTVLDAGGAGSVVRVAAGASVEIGGLTLTGGLAPRGGGLEVEALATASVADCVISACAAVEGGGGIANRGTLSLARTGITGNVGSGGSPSLGGGIDSAGALAMEDCTIAGNTADHGGGVHLTGTAAVVRSVLENNHAALSGGGLYGATGDAGVVTLTDCAVVGNTALNGGGLELERGTVTVQLSRCSVGRNQAPGNGGGVRTVQPGSLFLDHSILAQNVAGFGGDAADGGGPDCSGAVVSRGHNLLGQPAGCDVRGDVTGNQVLVDPLWVDPSGGDFSLQPGSPCIDAGAADRVAGGVGLDGVPRLLDGDLDGRLVLDVGAFEFSHVRLFAAGDLRPGGALCIDVRGSAGLDAFVVLGTRSSEFPWRPYGALLVEPLAFLNAGTIPVQHMLAIPPGLAVPVTLYLQGLAVDAALRGNLSNRVEVTIEE